MTDGTDQRAERLKAALRENLRRRKAQGRGRAAEQAVAPDTEQAPEKGPTPGGPDSDKISL